MEQPEITTHELTTLDPNDVLDLEKLMPFLSPRFKDVPIPTTRLQEIISSPSHEQFVARCDGRIIGAATMSIVMGAAMGKEGYLSDFVVHPEARGTGASQALWGNIVLWSTVHKLDVIRFTSHQSREAAHRFYEKQGATIVDTTVFEVATREFTI